FHVTGVQTCALPIFHPAPRSACRRNDGDRHLRPKGRARALALRPRAAPARRLRRPRARHRGAGGLGGLDRGPPAAERLRSHPRPTKGILVAMIVIDRTLVDSGRLAMCRTAAATSAASIIGSARTDPSACGTPDSILAASSVRALPMSICPAAIPKGRPSRASVFVSPVIACFVVV